MKATFLCEKPLLVAIASLLLYAHNACAADSGGAPPANNAGFTVLDNATNVTHWGLGGGVGIGASPYKHYGAKVSPIPLFYFDDKWIHALGTSLDVKVGNWFGVSAALRLQYALDDGYRGSDAPILNGMQTRKAGFWVGPSLTWTTRYGELYGSYLVAGNKGRKAEVGFGKKVDYGRFSLEPHIGAAYYSAKYVDYYYGVRPYEARSGRAAYSGRATFNESIGTKLDYRLTAHQVLILDVDLKHLGAGITDSPLVNKKLIPEVRIGYLYRFN